MLKALGNWASKHWDTNLTEAAWLVNTRGSAKGPDPRQTKPQHTVGEAMVPVVLS